ncbi:2-oxo acid dehydrogenase subunit E2 [Allohahella marinimesophila]
MSDFNLPDVGEGIVECEVVEWLVSEGDEIEEDQPVVEVMTDKALVEITAPEAGRITRLYYQKEALAKVHSPLFAYMPKGEAAEQGLDEASGSSGGASSGSPSETSSSSESEQPSKPATEARSTSIGEQMRIPASPAVRRLAREHDLHLEDISGSGKDGRVLKEDIQAYLDEPSAAHQAADQADSTQAVSRPASESGGSASERSVRPSARPKASQDVRIEPIRGVRAVMARRMVESASTIPHFIFSEDIDVTDLLNLHQQLKPAAEAAGIRLTLMPFIMKAMALAIQKFPIVNSRLNEDVTEIHYQPSCNIGMAVDTEAGLIVPNIKGVESLTLFDIASEVARLTEAAREGRVSQADMKDGTITISNIGVLGGTYAAPIINAPEVAIVALGRTQHLPRFDNKGQVVSRAIMPISWAGDHRIIDGGTMARFSNCWKGFLESPQSMLLHMG